MALFAAAPPTPPPINHSVPPTLKKDPNNYCRMVVNLGRASTDWNMRNINFKFLITRTENRVQRYNYEPEPDSNLTFTLSASYKYNGTTSYLIPTPEVTWLDEGEKMAEIKIALIRVDEVKALEGKSPTAFSQKGELNWWFNQIKTSKPKNELTIVCEVMENVTVKMIISLCLREMEDYSNLRDDLRKLYETRKISDVIVCADNKKLHAHKAVLAARSPVFAAMFEHDMEEQKQNKVEIPDFKQKTVEKMLLYIYTELATELDGDLFVAADKYDLKGLKAKCEEALLSKLTVKNAVFTLLLAYLHSAPRLQEEVVKFIKLHFDDIKDTSEWKEAIKAYPQLTIEILQQAMAMTS